MSSKYFFYFVTVSHNKKILKDNLLRSPIIEDYSLTVQKNFKNIAEAYNYTGVRDIDLNNIEGELIVIYVHHDVYMPPGFEEELTLSLDLLPHDWAVAGPAGVKLIGGEKKNFGHINDRGREWGKKMEAPVQVQTLDELMLITKGDLLFDEQFQFDFYGADLCMQAAIRKKKCFAINAFCDHNSGRAVGGRTPEFYEAEKKFRFKWFRNLPIVTTCSMLI